MTGASAATFSITAMPSDIKARVSALIRVALLLVAFSIPLEWPDRLTFEVTTLTGSLFLLTTLLQPGTCYGRVPWAMAAFALYPCIQLVALVVEGSSYPGGLYLGDVGKSFLLLILWMVFCWACYNLFRRERIYRATLWALVAGCLVRAALPLLGVVRTAHVQGTGGERVTALGQNANQSAQVLMVGLLALIGLAYIQPRGTLRWRVLGWGSVGLIAGGMVQTGSRGGILSFSVGLLVYLATGQSLKAHLRNAAAAITGLGLLFFLASHSEVMKGRLARAEAGSFSQREVILPTALRMVRDKPWLGWGPITNKYELASRLGDPTHGRRDPHNIVLEMLTSSGVIGAIPFFIGLWLCFRSAWQARAGPRGVVPLAMLLAVMAGSMGENRLAGPLLWLVLACTLASGSEGPILKSTPEPEPAGVAEPPDTILPDPGPIEAPAAPAVRLWR